MATVPRRPAVPGAQLRALVACLLVALAAAAVAAPARAAEPARTNPARMEPAGTNPALTNPARTSPARTNPARTSPARTAPAQAAAAARPFAITLGEPGDFVSQYTAVACVGASVQMMLNIMRPGADSRPATQARLLRSAQEVSNRVFVRRIGGASALGWAYALERAGGGPYRVRAYATRGAALRAVAVAIRRTGRPAGLLVWRGAHAWVVDGVRTSADPATGRFRITGLVIDDPWWPRATGNGGRSRPPGSVLSPAELARHFVRFQRGPRRSANAMNGAYVVVVPIEPAVIVLRARGVL